jgi:hypothetical protein
VGYTRGNTTAGQIKETSGMEVRLRPRRKTATSSYSQQTVVLPNVCPECEGPGYLEHINLVRETKTQACRDCGLIWESAITDV